MDSNQHQYTDLLIENEKLKQQINELKIINERNEFIDNIKKEYIKFLISLHKFFEDNTKLCVLLKGPIILKLTETICGHSFNINKNDGERMNIILREVTGQVDELKLANIDKLMRDIILRCRIQEYTKRPCVGKFKLVRVNEIQDENTSNRDYEMVFEHESGQTHITVKVSCMERKNKVTETLYQIDDLCLCFRGLVNLGVDSAEVNFMTILNSVINKEAHIIQNFDDDIFCIVDDESCTLNDINDINNKNNIDNTTNIFNLKNKLDGNEMSARTETDQIDQLDDLDRVMGMDEIDKMNELEEMKSKYNSYYDKYNGNHSDRERDSYTNSSKPDNNSKSSYVRYARTPAQKIGTRNGSKKVDDSQDVIFEKYVSMIKFVLMPYNHDGYKQVGKIPITKMECNEECPITFVKPPYIILRVSCLCKKIERYISVMTIFGMIIQNRQKLLCPYCTEPLKFMIKDVQQTNIESPELTMENIIFNDPGSDSESQSTASELMSQSSKKFIANLIVNTRAQKLNTIRTCY